MKHGIKPLPAVLHSTVLCMGRETQSNLPVLHCSEQHIWMMLFYTDGPGADAIRARFVKVLNYL